MSVARMLERNSTLRALTLAKNFVAERGAEALRAALKANTRNGGALKAFDLRVWLSRPHQVLRDKW